MSGFLTVSACADENGLRFPAASESEGTSASEDADDNNSEEASNDETSRDDSTEGSSQDESSEPSETPRYAGGGITITEIELNQGAGTQVFANQQVIPANKRNIPIVAGRPLLVRAMWEVPEDWNNRELEGRLYIEPSPDEEDQEGKENNTPYQTHVVNVEGPPSKRSLAGTFSWLIEEDDVTEDLKIRVEIWEIEEFEGTTADADEAPVVPSLDSFLDVEVEAARRRIKVVIVPVEHNVENCVTDTRELLENPEELQKFVDALYEHNPVQEVEIRVREESIVQNTRITNLASLFLPLQRMRDEDRALPNEYYFGLVNACTGGIGGVAGIAPGTPDPNFGGHESRVSVGLYLPVSDHYLGTFVHELGHNQGLGHVDCGNPDNPDNSYPYPTNQIGVWGFNVLNYRVYAPTSYRDYMSYCNPTWVSDWNWSWTAYSTVELTKWDFPDAPDFPTPFIVPETQDYLIGLRYPSGEEEWWQVGATGPSQGTTPSLRSSPASNLQYKDVELFDIEGHRYISPAELHPLDDGSLYIRVPIPDSLGPLAQLKQNNGETPTTRSLLGIEKLGD